MADIFGAEFRRVDHRPHLGTPGIVAVAARTYDTPAEELWTALTEPKRLVRWFSRVEGELTLGGRYRIEGNASGTITRCDPAKALDLTWEFMGQSSWLSLRLEPVGSNAERARLTLEHLSAKAGVGEEHLKRFGPAAVGVGWDLSLHGLAQHLNNPEASIDPAAFEAWSASDEGKSFVRASGQAWGAADVAGGERPDVAQDRAERTIAFYTGA